MNSKCFLAIVLMLSFIATSAEPRIKFIEAYKNIGTISVDEKSVDFEILYTNIGDSPLYITEIVSFCPCINTDFCTEALVPGDTAKVIVHYQFRHEGKFSNPLRFYYNSEDPEYFVTSTFIGCWGKIEEDEEEEFIE